MLARLLVAGNEREATIAAASRGMATLGAVDEHSSGIAHYVTVCGPEKSLVMWYLEIPRTSGVPPYRPGTLIQYWPVGE